jgi:ABC-type polysaccharide/polyol phosphate export permease
MAEPSAREGVDLTAEPPPVSRLLSDLWASRRLAYMLARRDFFVRYRRARLGLAWAVVVPLSQALVLALVIGRLTKIRTTDDVPLTLFVFAGMIAWSFLSTAFGGGATAIADGAGLTTKIYFPRAVLPLVTVGAAGITLLLNVVVLLVMCPFFGVVPTWRLLLLPAALALLIAFTAGLSLVLSAVHVHVRDVRYLLEAASRALFYATPVFYPLHQVGELRHVLAANPCTGVTELFRAATVGADEGWLTSLWWSLGWTAVIVGVGLELHRRFDRTFSDLL